MKGSSSFLLLGTTVAVIGLLLSGFAEIAEATHPKCNCLKKFRNCYEIKKLFPVKSGVYTIYPFQGCLEDYPLTVYCDMETDGGGWIVIQRRNFIKPRENFWRTWREYAHGFGNLMGEFWLGLDYIHALTNQTGNEIRFDLTDYTSVSKWAEYKVFSVNDREDDYRVKVNHYTGNAGDSFSFTNNQKFTTRDKDHDTAVELNCAAKYKGAWWYTKCHSSNLNGLPHKGNHSSYADGINWKAFKGYHYSLKKTEMKIRPAQDRR